MILCRLECIPREGKLPAMPHVEIGHIDGTTSRNRAPKEPGEMNINEG